MIRLLGGNSQVLKYHYMVLGSTFKKSARQQPNQQQALRSSTKYAFENPTSCPDLIQILFCLTFLEALRKWAPQRPLNCVMVL